MTDITLQQADETTISAVVSLLEQNDLPAGDVRENSDTFYLAFADGERVGAGGLEQFGSDGLLRSVVVEHSARGNGFGVAICEEIEKRAERAGVETLYLLTTTVPELFRTHGYTEIERSAPPPRIQQTTEFDDLCPASAVCFEKSL